MATHAEFTSGITAGRADGVLTTEERKEAKKRAMAKLVSYCGYDDIAWSLEFGAANEALSDEIENALHTMKAAGLVPRSGRGSMLSSESTRPGMDGSISEAA